MRISQITITDTFGTDRAKFSPRSITRISGPNRSGKTSILRALSKLFEGGHDPSVIRHGAEKSIVEVLLDDGTQIIRTCGPVKRRKGEDAKAPIRYSTTVDITDPDGTPRSAPQTFIKELGEASAVDPGEILRIDATTAPGRKQLAEILLRIMPIVFTPEEIADTLSGDYRPGSSIPALDLSAITLPEIIAAMDLDGLKAYVGKVTEQRRRMGQTRDDSDGAINRLRKSLPDDDSTDYADALEQAEARKLEVETAIHARQIEIEQAKSNLLREAEGKAKDACAAIDRDIDAKILELEKERAVGKKAAQATLDAAREGVALVVAEEVKSLNEMSAPLLQEAIADIASLKQKREAQLKAVTLREEIVIQEGSFRLASGQYKQLTEVLERLELLRKQKLDSLPVPGLEVSGDTVSIDGVPWQNVNTARRIEVALQLCTLRSGKLGLLLLDDAEHLDDETRRMLEEGIAAAGYQLIEAMVSNGCICGHDHPKNVEGWPAEKCGQCKCDIYQPGPLTITQFEPVAA